MNEEKSQLALLNKGLLDLNWSVSLEGHKYDEEVYVIKYIKTNYKKIKLGIFYNKKTQDLIAYDLYLVNHNDIDLDCCDSIFKMEKVIANLKNKIMKLKVIENELMPLFSVFDIITYDKWQLEI